MGGCSGAKSGFTGAPAGNIGSSDSPCFAARGDAWICRRANDTSLVRRSLESGGGVFVPRPSPPGAGWSHFRQLGLIRKQPQGQVLQDHGEGPKGDRITARNVGAVVGSCGSRTCAIGGSSCAV